jgi:exodeoxyribonuclease-3
MGSGLKLATWNVNSIRARQDRVCAWVDANRPDVLCLQEVKVEDDKFPIEPFQALGYEIAVFGQRTYNGVAILARAPLADLERGFGDDPEDRDARFLSATTAGGVRVVSVYVPNGQAVGSEKFAYKLVWLDRFRRYLASRLRSESRMAIAGDFNIAPEPIDVHDPARWEGHVLFSIPEREALARLTAETGLVDVVRRLHPGDPLFTWWDYRQLSFPRNHGLRIDHVLATPALAAAATAAKVDREARKGKQPSDHAPVVVEFAD